MLLTSTDLKEWRKKVKLTQKDFANVLGVSRGTVARWEAGEISIPPYLDLALKQIESDFATAQAARVVDEWEP